METEILYNMWVKKDPQWEARYEELMRDFVNYGKGVNQYSSDKGVLFGAAYELYIVAFFIGLYNDRRKKLNADRLKQKHFGWAIENWGNFDRKSNKVNYSDLMNYVFAALIARTDIDFIALDKGEISAQKVVSDMMDTMEEYANWGLYYIEDQRTYNPNAFFNETGFLSVFLDILGYSEEESEDDEIEDF